MNHTIQDDTVFKVYAHQLRPDTGVLVAWSGGMDSTLVLWKVLHLVPKDVPVIAYHVEFHNYQERGRVEAIACQQIVEKLRSDPSTPRNFIFSDSKVTVDTHRCSTWPIVATLAGSEANGRNCIFIADGRREYLAPNESRRVFHRQWKRSIRLYREMAYDPIFYFPLMWHTKKMVRSELPDFLIEAAWSCRSPGYGEGKFVPCGVCGPCRDYQAHGFEHRTVTADQYA